jgi:hypothetical protein
MKLSELYSKIQEAGDVHAYAVSLAAPDSDGVDVDLAEVGRVEIHAEQGQARLYPASTATDVDSIEPEPYLGMVLSQLPSIVSAENDLRLMVEIPLLRNDSGNDRVSLVEVNGIHIGRDSEEVWFLVRPPSEYASGLLPA